MLLPYLPYFSNCYGFESYIPIWMLFEGEQCELPDDYPKKWPRYKLPPLVDQDAVRSVGPFDFLQIPVADWCVQTIHCNYEEDLSQPDTTNRWFELPSGSTLFRLLREPVNYYEYTGRIETAKPNVKDAGGGAVIDKYADLRYVKWDK